MDTTNTMDTVVVQELAALVPVMKLQSWVICVKPILNLEWDGETGADVSTEEADIFIKAYQKGRTRKDTIVHELLHIYLWSYLENNLDPAIDEQITIKLTSLLLNWKNE